MSDPLSVQAAALAAVDRLIEYERTLPHVDAGLTMTLDGLEGRRRILQRRGPVLCPHCPERRRHYVDALFPMINWPSEDWRDAAAGLPLEGADHD